MKLCKKCYGFFTTAYRMHLFNRNSANGSIFNFFANQWRTFSVGRIKSEFSSLGKQKLFAISSAILSTSFASEIQNVRRRGLWKLKDERQYGEWIGMFYWYSTLPPPMKTTSWAEEMYDMFMNKTLIASSVTYHHRQVLIVTCCRKLKRLDWQSDDLRRESMMNVIYKRPTRNV